MVEQATLLEQDLQLGKEHDVGLSMVALQLQQALNALCCSPQEWHRPAVPYRDPACGSSPGSCAGLCCAARYTAPDKIRKMHSEMSECGPCGHSTRILERPMRQVLKVRLAAIA